MATFEKYYPFVAKDVTDDKAKLLKHFENFLNDPLLYGGSFVVWCKEEDGLYNSEDILQYIDNIII